MAGHRLLLSALFPYIYYYRDPQIKAIHDNNIFPYHLGKCMSRPTIWNKHNRVSFIDIEQIFIDNFNYRNYTTMTFPPKLLDSITWAIVKQFQLHLTKATSDLEHIYISYRFFILVVKVTWLHYAELIFLKSNNFNAFSKKDFDTYEQNGDHLYHCQSYINIIQKSKSL